MKYLGIDLGYREPTTIVLFDDSNPKNLFTFSSLSAQTEFADVVEKVVLLMQKHQIPLKNVHAPRFPALERELDKIFRKD